MNLQPPLRPATPDDAPILARLVDFAGEGMPTYIWAQMAEPGQSMWDVGAGRACRDELYLRAGCAKSPSARPSNKGGMVLATPGFC